MQDLSLIQTILLAVVEGLTEFVPVSSTGHILILQSLLGVESTDFVKAFTIMVQLGAILSVVFVYRKRFFHIDHELSYCETTSIWKLIAKYDFYYKLLLGFLPTAVVGYLFKDTIDKLLENVDIVAGMLVLGGLFMLFTDKFFKNDRNASFLTNRKAFNVGLFQCLALIPGVSRSMAAIIGGMVQKLTRKEAVEFSFFLAVPSLITASGYKMVQLFLEYGLQVFITHKWELIIGNLAAFIVSSMVIRLFINFIMKHGFTAFGWYRIMVGGCILLMNLIKLS